MGKCLSPNEDLMQEHGLLDRILLIYEKILSQIETGGEYELEVLSKATQMVKDFVQNFHEEIEENYVFSLLQKENKLVDEVRVLFDQHHAGKKVVEEIWENKDKSDSESRERIADSIRRFLHMYRPHKSREDTLVFPTFKLMLSPNEFNALGERIEKLENQRFGQEAFERFVNEAADMERKLGINSLAEFTPKVPYVHTYST